MSLLLHLSVVSREVALFFCSTWYILKWKSDGITIFPYISFLFHLKVTSFAFAWEKWFFGKANGRAVYVNHSGYMDKGSIHYSVFSVSLLGSIFCVQLPITITFISLQSYLLLIWSLFMECCVSSKESPWSEIEIL